MVGPTLQGATQMKKILLILGVFGICSSAMGINPHFRLLRAKENTVKATEIGTRYSSIYESQHGQALILFDRLMSEYKVKKINGLSTLRVNWELHGSDHDYLAWMLFQGLVRYSLEKKFKPALPELFEFDGLVWLESMRYLDQLGVIIDQEMDYASHPRFDFARRRDLSIVRFYRLFKRSRKSFNKAISDRKKRLEGKSLKVVDFLKRTDLTTSQRKAGEQLQLLWEQSK